MSTYEVCAKEARQKFLSGQLDDAISLYKNAIGKLASLIRTTTAVSLRNKYVEVRNVLQDEMNLVEGMHGMEQGVRRKFEKALIEEGVGDSPPADPAVTSRSAASLPPPTSKQTTYALRKKPVTHSVASVNTTKKTTSVSSISTKRDLRRSSVNQKSGKPPTPITTNSSANVTYANLNAGPIGSHSSAKSTDNTSETGSVISSADGALKTFDSSGFDPELVSLVQNGMLQQTQTVKWNDIAGLESVKDLLTEAIVLPMEYPDLFKGIRSPWRGICMFGPPGTGKTLLAKAVASECKTTFFSVSSALLASKFRGESEKLVRLLFEMARFHSPATIFIDEIDSICSTRGSSSEHEASRRVKSELLIQMDGCSSEPDKTVLVLAATNFPWDLDEALRRRLEKRIYIPLPDFGARLGLLKNALQEVQLAEDVDLEQIARRLEGYSGSDITNICRDAAMGPMRECLRNSKDDLESRRRALESKPDLTIYKRHFDVSIRQIMPSVSHETVARYVEWMKEFGSK